MHAVIGAVVPAASEFDPSTVSLMSARLPRLVSTAGEA